MASIK